MLRFVSYGRPPYCILRKHAIKHINCINKQIDGWNMKLTLSVHMQKDFICSCDHFPYICVHSRSNLQLEYITTHICNYLLLSKTPTAGSMSL